MATNDGPSPGRDDCCGGNGDLDKVDNIQSSIDSEQQQKQLFASKGQQLPERVCQLFLMQPAQHHHNGTSSVESPFFRSPFLQQRLPQMLFSNGAIGLSPGSETSSTTSVVRNIPIKVINSAEGKPREVPSNPGRMGSTPIGSERLERPLSPPSDRFSLMSSPEMRRHFASLFWTPQQAKRIAEREEHQQRQPEDNFGDGRLNRSIGGGSSVTVYSFPVNSMDSVQSGQKQERNESNAINGNGWESQQEVRNGGQIGQAQPNRQGPGPYSAIPFRRRQGMNAALSTPSLFGANEAVTSPTNEKPPIPPHPISNSSVNISRPRPTAFPANPPQQPPQRAPNFRRTQTAFALAQQELPRRDSEPNIVLADQHKNGFTLRMASPARQSALGDSSSTATLSEDGQSSLSGVSVTSSSEGGGQSRSKSPSLASLRQSLFRLRPSRRGGSVYSLPPVPSCIRGRQSSGSESSDAETETDSSSCEQQRVGNGSRGRNGLTASSLRLTQFAPNRPKEERPALVDTVEEAIRSLEQFDPSEFVQRQYREPKQPTTASASGPRIFLAKAEPVPIRQPLSTSLPTERHSSLSSCVEDHPSPPRLELPRRPSTGTIISSGSATPTQPSAFEGHPFSHSMELLDSNRTPRANSPVEQQQQRLSSDMDQLISRLGGQQQHHRRRGVTFNDKPTQHFYSPFDGPPPDYSESGSGDSPEDGSMADSEADETNSSAAALEAEAQLRKRFLCSQLTDCAKVVEINALKMGQFVAAGSGLGGWRQPHILRHNLGAIRDTIYTIEFALDELVETLDRVSLDARDPRRAHLRQLVQPVQTSLALLRRLRASLDSIGWSLSAMARPREARASSGQDALDQLVAVLPQLPKDCSKLVQWIYSLSVWPDQRAARTGVTFLPSSATTGFRPHVRHPPPPAPAPMASQNRRAASPTSSLQNYYSSSSGGEDEHSQQQQKQNKEKPPSSSNGTSTKSASSEVMDGGESTSSTSSVQTMEPEATAANNGMGKGADTTNELVLEEDDLVSVVSEPPDHWQDANGRLHSPPGASSLHRRVNAELARSLSPEQRDLFRLYEPQVDSHVAAMCTLIEEFFTLVEAHSEARLSFQKIQMVYIEGHSLVGIGRVLCRDDAISQHRPLNAFLAHECAKLDTLLNECLAAAKVAKTKAQSWAAHQTVPAVQGMCQAVVAVSECANQMRAFWRNCAG